MIPFCLYFLHLLDVYFSFSSILTPFHIFVTVLMNKIKLKSVVKIDLTKMMIIWFKIFCLEIVRNKNGGV